MTVGNSGTILTSTDGTSWTSRTSGTTENLNGVTYDNNSLFVAEGGSGTILTSPDGTTWTSRTSGTTKGLRGVTYENSTFVSVGNSGTILTSSNGTTWTSISVGDSGNSWTSVTSPTTKFLPAVTSGNNNFVAVGEDGTIVRSTDNGSSFSTVTSPTANSLDGVTFGNNTFVAVGDNGNIVRSTDNGTTFDNATSPISAATISYEYAGQLCTQTGVCDPGFWEMGDIITKSQAPGVCSATPGQCVGYVQYPTASYDYAKLLSDITPGCYSMSCSDSWPIYLRNTYTYRVGFGNNSFVAVGDNGTIVRSTDNGSSFDNVTSPTANTLWEVAF